MNGTAIEFDRRTNKFDPYADRLRKIHPDLIPNAKIHSRTRVGGEDRVDGSGGWWKFYVSVGEGGRWYAQVRLDDGQRSVRSGIADSRHNAEAAGRKAVTEMMLLWAEVRTRVRRCHSAVLSNALVEYRPPPAPKPLPWWKRLLMIFRSMP